MKERKRKKIVFAVIVGRLISDSGRIVVVVAVQSVIDEQAKSGVSGEEKKKESGRSGKESGSKRQKQKEVSERKGKRE